MSEHKPFHGANHFKDTLVDLNVPVSSSLLQEQAAAVHKGLWKTCNLWHFAFPMGLGMGKAKFHFTLQLGVMLPSFKVQSVVQ